MPAFRPRSATFKIVLALLFVMAVLLSVATFDGRVIPGFNALVARAISSPAPRLAGRSATPAGNLSEQAYCEANQPVFAHPFVEGVYWNGWGVDLNNRRFQPTDHAGLSKDDVGRLKLKWAFGIPGDSETAVQPTVAAGRLLFGSGAGKVYSVDAASGCVYWTFDAGSRIRTAITIGPIGDRWAAYFADGGGNGARAYAVDAATGRLIWKTLVDDSRYSRVSGTPALASGMLFVPVTAGEDALAGNPDFECCHFQGALAALDAGTGRTIWKSSTIALPSRPVRKNSHGVQQWGPSGAGIWSAPTVDLSWRAIYVGTGDSHSEPAAITSDAILAFDMDTGAMLWSRQMTAGDAWNMACADGDPANCPDGHGSDLDFATPPILVDLRNGKRALIAGQKSGVVYALDPDNRGREIWRARVGSGGADGGIVAASSVDERNVYVALSDVVDPFLRPPQSADPWNRRLPYEFAWLWNRAINHLRSSDSGGGTFALSLESGERVWYSPPQCEAGEEPRCRPGQMGAVTGIPGIVFSGTLDGHIRAYATDDGRVVWSTATGGSMARSGPVIAGGALYLNTGTSGLSDPNGNALLAFSVDGK